MKSIFLTLLLLAVPAEATRIKDLASIRGARVNQLSGYGIVVGLSNSGDRGFPLTDNSLGLVVKGLGVEQRIPKAESRNAAAVMVTALLPAFSRVGAQLDVTVSSIGTATSLDGGTLMMTALKAPDGKVYGMAQGKLITTKRAERLRGGPTGQSLVTATIPGGGLVEREVEFDMTQQHEIEYQLLAADFTTAARVARAINEELGGKYATPKDAGTVHVIFPYSHTGTPVDVIAQIENIEVEMDRRAKVVINQRTGTIVLGSQVKILPVAIAHNNLAVEVRELASTAQGVVPGLEPPPKPKKVMLMEKSATIADLVGSLNEMGASADDLVALIQSLKSSGALVAEVVIQ